MTNKTYMNLNIIGIKEVQKGSEQERDCQSNYLRTPMKGLPSKATTDGILETWVMAIISWRLEKEICPAVLLDVEVFVRPPSTSLRQIALLRRMHGEYEEKERQRLSKPWPGSISEMSQDSGPYGGIRGRVSLRPWSEIGIDEPRRAAAAACEVERSRCCVASRSQVETGEACRIRWMRCI